MYGVPVKTLLECGVHFGHRASRWNPKMAPFIHGKRNLIHIIDLKETLRGLLKACSFLQKLSSDGHQVLFVGTKRQAQSLVQQVAENVSMPYVADRWLGGTLTNFQTIRSRLKRLEELEIIETSEAVGQLSKKEVAAILREKRKIARNLQGIRKMEGMPGAIVVIDPRKEKTAVNEARKMGVPCIAILDTDCDPTLIDIPIPGNDDAMRSVQLILSRLGDAMDAGLKNWQAKAAELEKIEADKRKVEEAKRAEMDRRRQVEQDWQKKLKAEAEARRARANTEAALQALEHEAGSREEGVTRPIEDEPEEKPARDAKATDAPAGEKPAGDAPKA